MPACGAPRFRLKNVRELRRTRVGTGFFVTFVARRDSLLVFVCVMSVRP
jgi:hypothetical protein